MVSCTTALPHVELSGTIRALVVFARFPDGFDELPCNEDDWPDPDVVPAWADSLVEGSVPADTVGSMTHFFDMMSHGRHVVLGDVYGEVVVTPRTIADYVSSYGDRWERIKRANMDVTRAVITALDTLIVPYDHDRDGYLDHMHIVYRNFRNASGSMTEGFNAISWHVTAESTFVLSDDRTITVDCETGSCQRSILTSAPDSTIVARRSRRVVFDYLGNGQYIDGFTLAKLGWVQPIVLDASSVGGVGDTTVVLAAVPDPGSYAIVRTPDPSQYFVLELRNEDLDYAKPQGPAGCRSVRGYTGLLVSHIIDDAPGGHMQTGWSGGYPPIFDPEVLDGMFVPETGAPDPVGGEDRIQRYYNLPYTGRATDVGTPGGSDVFGPFTNPTTHMYERPPGYSNYGRPQTRPSGITIHGLEWAGGGDDSMRVTVRFEPSTAVTGADTIRADMTWNGLVQLTGDLVIAPGVYLTIQDGSRIIMKAGPGEDRHQGGRDPERVEVVARGTADVRGAAEGGVTFTSSRDNDFVNWVGAGESTEPAPGDWHSLRFQDTDPAAPSSSLDFATFEYPVFAVELDSLSGDLYRCKFSAADSADVYVPRDVRIPPLYTWHLEAPTKVVVNDTDPFGEGADPLRVEITAEGLFFTERPAGGAAGDSVWFTAKGPSASAGSWAGIRVVYPAGRASVKDASIGYAVDPLTCFYLSSPAEVERSSFHHYTGIGVTDAWSRLVVRNSRFEGSGSSDPLEGAAVGIKSVLSLPRIEGNTVGWHRDFGIKLEWSKVACANMDGNPNALEDSVFVRDNVLTGNGENDGVFQSGTGLSITWGCVKRHLRIVDNAITDWYDRGVDLFQCAETRLACNRILDNRWGVRHSRNTSASGQPVRLQANEVSDSYDVNLWADDVVKLRLYDPSAPAYARENAFQPDSADAMNLRFNIDHQDGSLSVLDARYTLWRNASGGILGPGDSTYVRQRIRGNRDYVTITNPQTRETFLCGLPGAQEGAGEVVYDGEAPGGGGPAVAEGTVTLALGEDRGLDRTEFVLDAPSGSRWARVRVYDVRGRLVASVLDAEELPAGRHRIAWNRRDREGRAGGVRGVLRPSGDAAGERAREARGAEVRAVMRKILSLGAAGVLAAASTGEGAVWRVPEDLPSVLAALDVAVSGDSVLVGPGTWTERDTRMIVIGGGVSPIRASGFIRSGVTLIGTDGPDATLLPGDPATSAGSRILAFADQGTIGRTVIKGLTLRGLGQPFVGMTTSRSGTVVFEDCIIERMGLGLIADFCTLELRRCTLRENDATGLDAQVAGIDGFMSHLTVEDTVFERNRGAVVVESSGDARSTAIRRCRFVENADAKVLLISYSDPLVIEGNLFLRNTASTGAGTCVAAYNSRGRIAGNTIVGNSVQTSMTGTLVYVASQTDVLGNTFYGTTLPTAMSAVVWMNSDGPFQFRQNVIAGTSVGLAVRRYGGYQPVDGCNVFWENEGGHFLGYVPRPTDVIADPLFCDPAAMDFTVRSDSPCLPGGVPGCGQIGAWGLGCGIVSVEATSWGRIKQLYREGDAR